MIYDYSLCIHDRHFINWIVLGVTRYINVIAINSEVGYIFLYHVTRWLINADQSNLLFLLHIVSGDLGKPSRYLHRGTQTAQGQDILAPVQCGFWLSSRGNGRKKKEWEGKLKLYVAKKNMNLSCYFFAQQSQEPGRREKGEKSRANRRKVPVKSIQQNLVRCHFTGKLSSLK